MRIDGVVLGGQRRPFRHSLYLLQLLYDLHPLRHFTLPFLLRVDLFLAPAIHISILEAHLCSLTSLSLSGLGLAESVKLFEISRGRRRAGVQDPEQLHLLRLNIHLGLLAP